MIKIFGLNKQHDRLNKLIDYLNDVALGEVTQDAYDKAKELVKPHHQTGKLEYNLSHKVSDNIGYVWVDNHGMLVDWRGRKINYAVFVHFGTKEHDITPKNKKALRFVGKDGLFTFTKRVEHPGYKGDRFMYKAGDYAKERFKNILRRLTNE